MQTLYIAIRDELLARIEDGTYPVGSTIPTELELAEAYGVSRPTVRQALQLLVDAGYLDRRRKRGTIVCDPADARKTEADGDVASAPRERVGEKRDPDIEAGGTVRDASNRRVRTIAIRAQQEPAPQEVADALGVPVGTDTYRLVRVRYMDNDPNIFIVNHLLAEPYPGLLDADFSRERMYVRMAQVGRPVVRARRRLELVEADGTLAEILDVPVGEPLFLFHVTGYDDTGRAVEYSRTIYRGKENTFEFSTSHDPLVIE